MEDYVTKSRKSTAIFILPTTCFGKNFPSQGDNKLMTGVYVKLVKLDKTELGIVHNIPFPEAARSKAWVCGSSLAGIAGSNPAEGMDVCLL
jgi:hypothetical protein